MRYLFIHQNFPGQFAFVAPALAARGHEVVALGINKAPEIKGVRHVTHRPEPIAPLAGAHPLKAGLEEWHVKVARGHSAAAAMRRLRDEGFVPDVVAVHPGWGEALFVRDVFPAARMLAYGEYYYGTPGGDTDFDPEFGGSPSPHDGERLHIKNTHLLHALSDCDLALSPTEFQRSRHPAWAQPKIRVIHDGINTALFRPNPQATIQLAGAKRTFKVGDELVTFVARQLEPYRGYHIFMRALPILQRLRPDAHVLIVGGEGASYGAQPPAGQTWRNIFLKEVAGQLDMGRVHYVGQVPHQVLTGLMQVSAAHVYLTYPFVLSWSLLEAMSIGCLVVGSATAPLQEVVQDGVNGLLTDFFDPEALAHRIAYALEHRAALQHLRAAARETVVQRFDLQSRCLPALVGLLEGMAAAGGASAPAMPQVPPT
jgi:glycosyltransferase involved in cell wall biosynthesis